MKKVRSKSGMNLNRGFFSAENWDGKDLVSPNMESLLAHAQEESNK